MLKIDITQTYNPYMKAYINAKGLKDGDEYMPHEYLTWIQRQHNEFRKANGIDGQRGYTAEQGQMFRDYLRGRLI